MLCGGYGRKNVKLVSKIFAIEDFKSYQLNCRQSLMEYIDCFICQPADSGKSIIFQALPFLSFAIDNNTTSSHQELVGCCSYKLLVISPLTSLMQDQENYLNSRGVRAGLLSSNKEYTTEVSFFVPGWLNYMKA